MRDLDVIDLYERFEDNKVEKFLENTESTIHTKTELEKVEEDTEWMDIMEETIPYIDGIFRNPNKFIINEEEIVKIEMTKKVTVESIKHLSKNTNFIQEVDKRTGDVTPSKLLNVRKEESYDTYENRVVYTLMQNIRFFISKKREYIEARKNLEEKNNKSIDYTGKTRINGEVVDMEMHINTKLEENQNKKTQADILLERINRISQKVNDITFTELYKILEKMHCPLVTPPIKKTNMILKNVRFQYAMKLWEYMQVNLDDTSRQVKERDEKNENEEIKALVDETFLLDYLIARTLIEDDLKTKEKLRDKVTTNLIQRILSINPNMPLEEFKKMIGDKYEIIKNRNVATTSEIQAIFKKHIDEYMQKVK